MTTTLHRRHHPLDSTAAQREKLESTELPHRFEAKLSESGLLPLRSRSIDTLQINVGKQCNQTCAHCHVDAGPDRREMMSDEVVDACLRLLTEGDIPALDITGGAPELHPRFRDIVQGAARAGRHVMHRCNLTAILLPKFADIPELLAEHRVEVIASLPYFLKQQTDAQRGQGVFEASLDGLRALNELGYGRDERLPLNLVTNPVGAFLPARQEALERDWRRELERRYGIVFNHLYTITNMPISRFLEFLVDREMFEDYMTRLANAFNPVAARDVMCRDMLSIGWDGRLYDCDFNQMLELTVRNGSAGNLVHRVEPLRLLAALRQRDVAVGQHCFGCTAGAGSSCSGATT